MISASFLPCSGTLLALPQVGKSWIRPYLPSWARIGPFTPRKCHVSVKLWNLCVCLEMASSFYLRVSECACTLLCTRVYAEAFLNKQNSPPPKRGTLDFCQSENLPCVLVLNPGHPVCTLFPPCGDAQ